MSAEFSIDSMMVAGCASRRAVRHWEDLGLLGDVARTAGDTRRYTAEQISRAKIIAAGQFGGFDLETIGRMLAEYHNSGEVHEALTMRLADQIRAAIRLQENLPKPAIPAQEYDL